MIEYKFAFDYACVMMSGYTGRRMSELRIINEYRSSLRDAR